MLTHQFTNTKHISCISIERYHPIVSIMLKYLHQIKTSGERLCCHAVKIDNFFRMTDHTLLSNVTIFLNNCEKTECSNEAYFRPKKI